MTQFHFPPIANIYGLSALLSLFLGLIVIWRRTSPESLPFAFAMFSLSIWSFASILEAGALTIEGKIVSSIWEYVGITTISTFWLIFCAELTGKHKVLSRPWNLLIWVVPAITLVLVITNNLHGLIWKRVYFPENAIDNIAVYEHGAFFYFFVIYNYSLLFIGTLWLIRKFLTFPAKRRVQVVIILACLAIGWIANILYLLDITPIQGLDITPISFVFIGIVLAWALYRRHLFDLVPIARSVLVDHMTDGVIVLDEEDRVVDFNQAALKVTHYKGENPLGKTIWEMYSDYLPYISHLINQTDIDAELELPLNPPLYLDVKIDSINDNESRGQVITIRDVTERKCIEIQEKEQRLFSEALARIAALLNSSLKLEDVLENILNQAANVVPHDTVNIALLNKEGRLHYEKVRGYEKYGASDAILRIEVTVDEIPNLKLMAESGKPLIVNDTYTDPQWRSDIPGIAWIRSYMGAPIVNQGVLLGFINLDAATPHFFEEKHMHRLQAFADQAAIAIRNAQLFEEKENLSIKDDLTGLYNHRYFYECAEREMQRSLRYHKDFSLIMMDIDHFKKVNDRYGHQAGDELLQNVANNCLSSLRKSDILCRFGGDEFITLLPETNKNDALKIARRIREVAASSIFHVKQDKFNITLSLGVAAKDDACSSVDALVSAADEALYKAKKAGRNCVRVSD